MEFAIFFVLSIVAFGVASTVTMFGSSPATDYATVLRTVLANAFFTIFGDVLIYDTVYFQDKFFDANYSRDSCLAADPTDVCPFQSGVEFTYVFLIFYLILMNLVFLNLLISTFA